MSDPHTEIREALAVLGANYDPATARRASDALLRLEREAAEAESDRETRLQALREANDENAALRREASERETAPPAVLAGHIEHWLIVNQKSGPDVRWARFPLGMVQRWIERAEAAEARVREVEAERDRLKERAHIEHDRVEYWSLKFEAVQRANEAYFDERDKLLQTLREIAESYPWIPFVADEVIEGMVGAKIPTNRSRARAVLASPEADPTTTTKEEPCVHARPCASASSAAENVTTVSPEAAAAEPGGFVTRDPFGRFEDDEDANV